MPDFTKDVKEFWNRILLTKHSDETLHVLGKTISQEFFSPNEITSSSSTYLNSDWLNNMRIGTHNRMLSLRSFFTKDWFVEMFIEVFTYPVYIITQGGLLWASYQFIHVVVTTIVNVINSLQINKLFDKKIGFAALFFASSTGIVLKRLVKFFNHNPEPEPEDPQYEEIDSKKSKKKKKNLRKPSSKSHSLNDLLDTENTNPNYDKEYFVDRGSSRIEAAVKMGFTHIEGIIINESKST